MSDAWSDWQVSDGVTEAESGTSIEDKKKTWEKVGNIYPKLSIAKGYPVRGLFREGDRLHGLVYLRAIKTWFASSWDLNGHCLCANTGPEWQLSDTP